MTQDRVLVATSVNYCSQNDEGAFFWWLDQIECVESYDGSGRDLFIRLRHRPDPADLREIIAIFYRYEVDLAQLTRFETPENREWLRDPQKYWHERMYGNIR